MACSTSDSEAGIIAAAPIACRARAATSASGDGARPPSADAAVNSAIAARNTRRRPMRSASTPAGTRHAANTMVYAFSTHDRVEVLASGKAWASDENATKRIVVSRKTAKTAVPATSRTARSLYVWVGDALEFIKGTIQFIKGTVKERS